MKKKLLNLCGEKILFDFPLSKISYFKIGGVAKYLIKVDSQKFFLDVVQALNKLNQKFIVIGKGSNILINDKQIKGVVLMRENAHPKLLPKNVIEFPSSTPLNKAIQFAQQNMLYGMEFLTGIPGSIGGAVVMNAGVSDGEIKDILDSVEIYRNKKIQVISKNDLNLNYRTSNIKSNEFIYSARFQLKKGSPRKIAIMKKKYLEIIEIRKTKQPLNFPSLGSTFKNPFPLHAGKIIEESGLKGMKVGGVSISKKHANFLINDGSGTTQDAIQLIGIIQKKILNTKKINLEKEIKLFGF